MKVGKNEVYVRREGVGLLALLFLLIGAGAYADSVTQASRLCTAFLDHPYFLKHPLATANGIVLDNTWTRIMGNKAIAALVVQPQNLQETPYTVVCTLDSAKTMVSDYQILEGNQLDRIRGLSKSKL